jgi:hypothetical protein
MIHMGLEVTCSLKKLIPCINIIFVPSGVKKLIDIVVDYPVLLGRSRCKSCFEIS